MWHSVTPTPVEGYDDRIGMVCTFWILIRIAPSISHRDVGVQCFIPNLDSVSRPKVIEALAETLSHLQPVNRPVPSLPNLETPNGFICLKNCKTSLFPAMSSPIWSTEIIVESTDVCR